MNIDQGDPCWVRNHKGEIVKAEYYKQSGNKHHTVVINKEINLAWGLKPEPAYDKYELPCVRFVLINRDIST